MELHDRYILALTALRGISAAQTLALLRADVSPEALFEGEMPALLRQDTAARLRKALREGKAEALARADEEIAFCKRHGIRILTLPNDSYPARLRDCADPPPVLFFKGNADLNARHLLAVVGTRRVTEYGKDVCETFCRELAALTPDVVVVSGLAYGVDIHAHRATLAAGGSTIGVLAHGLDRIYPAIHRKTAAEMTERGGLLTEYLTGTNPDKGNFVRRNRIIAGLASATLVVESAAKGGALITADLASGYGREVFACPGRIGDAYSEGCNALIRDNKAALVTSAADLANALRWTEGTPTQQPIQRELFPELTEEEARICDALRTTPEGIQINRLVILTGIPVYKLSSLLFELELKGVVKPMAGACYRLLPV